ncbi:hypothetical protein FHS70_004042 [Flammeovirga yaeyamensis]|nr:hypothetical protein [Flammeovirga yaeyamensis]
MKEKNFTQLIYSDHLNYYRLSLINFVLGLLLLLNTYSVEGMSYSSLLLVLVFSFGALSFLSIGLVNSYLTKKLTF